MRSCLCLCGALAALAGCPSPTKDGDAPVHTAAPPPTSGAPMPGAEPPAAPAPAHTASAPDSAVLARRRWSNVVNVQGSTDEAIQRALDKAGGGAIVVLPAGRYTIERTLEVRADDVLLVGAGVGAGGPDQEADASATVLVRAGDGGKPMLRVRGKKRAHVSGIRFDGVSDPASNSKDVGVLLEDAEDFRVDHSTFTHMGFAGVRSNGESRGVVDHSTFYADFKPSIGTDGYGVAVYGSDQLAGVPFGDADPSLRAVFVEDSRFALCRHAIAANKGGRYVFRHNQVTGGVVAHAVDAHGAEYSSGTGTEWIDVYENTIEQLQHAPPYYDGWAVRIRGGKGLVWNNVIRGYKTGIEITQETSEETGPVFVWGNTVDGTAVVRADHGAQGAAQTPPSGYHPHAYPHPLAQAACAPAAKKVQAGWAQVCAKE
jgi:hypothetical protein